MEGVWKLYDPFVYKLSNKSQSGQRVCESAGAGKMSSQRETFSPYLGKKAGERKRQRRLFQSAQSAGRRQRLRRLYNDFWVRGRNEQASSTSSEGRVNGNARDPSSVLLIDDTM
jgi:hypothetical protein